MNHKPLLFLTLSSFILMACVTEGTSLSSLSSVSSSVIDSSSGPLDESSLDSSSNTNSSSQSSSSVSSSFSSTTSTAALTNQQRIDLDIAALSYTPGGFMPIFGPNGTSISWTTSRPDIISNRGAFIELPYGASPVNVELTARVSYGGLSANKVFDVEVLPPEEVVLSEVIQLPFVNTSEEYLVVNQPQIDVYFAESGTVPFMDITDFLSMVDGAINFSLLDIKGIGDQLEISYRLADVDDNNQPIYWDYSASLDFAANTITVDDFSFFGNYVRSTETNFSDGLVFLGGIGLNARTVTIPLGDYRVDLVRKNNLYLAPISILNLLFLHSLYYDVYFNGDTLYGFDTFSALDSESPVLNQIRTSSFNTATMARDLRQSTYHFLALAFDYFYGLKTDKSITTFYDVLVPYMDRILTGNDRNLYAGLFSFVYGLDDLHSWFESPGYFESPSYSLSISSLGQLGTNTQAFYQGLWAKEDQIEAAFGVGNMPPDFRLLDNDTIAVIFIRGFNVDTPDFVNNILKDLPSTVESVILDLSFNTGGNVGAVIRLFGYMTEEPIQLSSMNPADGSAATYFYESEYEAYDFDWYIMTSSVTFSAANLMASMAKEMGVAKVIGTKSSGGAASIGVFVTPDGSILLRSTNNVFAKVSVDGNNNRTYSSIEAGVPIDFGLSNTFDNQAIIALINSIKQNQNA